MAAINAAAPCSITGGGNSNPYTDFRTFEDAIRLQLAPEAPAPLGDLSGLQVGFPEPSRPVGRQRTVRRAGDRIFGNAQLRRKKPADKIHRVARRGDDDSTTVQLRELRQIGRERPDDGFVRKDGDVVVGRPNLGRCLPEPFEQVSKTIRGSA